ncbi:MAG: rhodanese-like domain-containing protein [Lewinellaceae bacterium]|nr:rhodanese-like domain-containing protein [Saprospiraceae bacterium]MCB0543192.1 rhodanese-like domain-containing protein [Saprospiraceae bacterium]MCB9307005.1 rhodanese-like domain-containing protein [Lewinellaceae bacterium]MCB9355924.1 rhodanese-like domain-containing protein [Lewinellaceae bacterium]
MALSGLALAALPASAQVKSGAYRVMLKNLLSHTVPEIQVQEAARDSASIFFLDARETDEFEVSHLRGALHVGYDHFKPEVLKDVPKNRRIVVYCSVGYRSEKIAEKLLEAGYKNVSNLYGGIFEWVNQDHSVYDDKGRTARVHAYSRTWGVWLKKGKKVYGKQ